jgi:hypothetical protein
MSTLDVPRNIRAYFAGSGRVVRREIDSDGRHWMTRLKAYHQSPLNNAA